MAKERRKHSDQRKGERRRSLTEKEFKKLIEEGKATEKDKRMHKKRRGKKRRKRQVGI